MDKLDSEEMLTSTVLWTLAQPVVAGYVSSIVPNFLDAADILQNAAMLGQQSGSEGCIFDGRVFDTAAHPHICMQANVGITFALGPSRSMFRCLSGIASSRLAVTEGDDNNLADSGWDVGLFADPALALTPKRDKPQ